MKLDGVYENGGNTFCNVVSCGDGTYQIDINVDNIPSQNTGVTVICKFYYYAPLGEIDTDISPTQTVEIVSTQEYNFVIPGIYRMGDKLTDQFKDKYFYSLLLESYDNYKNTYLYSDGVSAAIGTLDLTTLSSRPQVDITGIEYFTNTAEINLNGVKLVSLSPFKNIDSANALTSLHLKNCALTDEKVTDSLKRLISLTALDISENSLSSFKYNGEAIFYRRLATLDASNQTVLRSLDGLEDVFGLTDLDVSSCNIDEFSPLKKMSSLENVYLYANSTLVSSELAFLYGTAGKVNIPIFVDLMIGGVNVYADEQNPTVALLVNSTLISRGDYLTALTANAIVAPTEHYGQIDLPTSIGADTDVKIAYVLTSAFLVDAPFSASVNGGLSGTGDAYSYTTSTQTLRVILELTKTIDAVNYTVYREFLISYNA